MLFSAKNIELFALQHEMGASGRPFFAL